MHGLPEQTATQAIADLQQAIDLDPTHISWYQLTIEPNTVFYNAPPQLPDDEKLADIQDAGEQLLAQQRYKQYEISAYCRAGRQSQHNSNYWHFGDYIGIGAGAHGKITHLHSQQIERRWKTRVPNDYLAKANPLAGSKLLTVSELPLEFLMNALRLNQGFDTTLFSERTGIAYSQLAPKIEGLIAKGLLAQTGNTVYATATGRRYLDSVLIEL